jgi:FK506-binding protein 4/5
MNEDFDIPQAEEMNEDFDLPEDKVGEERQVGDRGLKKKLLKEGEGWDTPEFGDEVQGTITITTITTSFSSFWFCIFHFPFSVFLF